MSTGVVGAISELIVTIDLMQRGFEVFRAVSPACSCDLAALRGGILTRVEVRTGTRYMTGSVSYSLAESEKGRHDVLAVVVDGKVTYTPDLTDLGGHICPQSDELNSGRPAVPPEFGVLPGSPLAVGAWQTGETLTVQAEVPHAHVFGYYNPQTDWWKCQCGVSADRFGEFFDVAGKRIAKGSV